MREIMALVENTIPRVLYHATYAPYLPSIEDHGIGGKPGLKNYDASEDGIVYLATSRNVAVSYAEVSEEVPEAFLEQIVVLAVAVSDLDPSKLAADRNVHMDEPEHGQTFEYHGVIKHFRVL
jgi:hypothetical protein